jgi:hypothetical protein
MLASIVIVTSFFDNTAVTPASDYIFNTTTIVSTSLHARVGNYYAFVAANSTIGINPSNLNQQHPAII